MKSVFRVFGLTLALIAAFYSSASAEPDTGGWVDCQYQCPDGPWVEGHISGDCCSEPIPYSGGGECTPVSYTVWTYVGGSTYEGTLGVCS